MATKTAEFVPDFFIVGAPKCGTSALYTYLKDHPSVFSPDNKEPHYFASDMYVRDTGVSARVKDPAAYRAMYDAAQPGQLTFDASTWYLFSDIAIPRILDLRPDAKFIVMLRDPTVMVQSLHNHYVRKLYEDVTDLPAAWRLQAARAKGDRLPRYCPDPKFLQYGRVCQFPDQLRRLYALVPPENIHLIVFEDFFAKVQAGYEAVLGFLGLPNDNRETFDKVNPNRSLKSPLIYKLLTYRPFPIDVLYPPLKRAANALGFHPGTAVFHRNVEVGERNELPKDFEAELKAYFSRDFGYIEEITGRSVDVWRA